MVPDPCMFGRAKITDTVGSRIQLAINTQLAADYESSLEVLFRHAENWRLAYMGVTIYQDGPTLSDQGTVCAAQVPVRPALIPCCIPDITVDAGGVVTHAAFASYNAMRYQQIDAPAFETLERMPNAYFGQSKNGCYMPLKLSTNHQQWHSQMDSCIDGTGWPEGGALGHSYRIPYEEVHTGWPFDGIMQSAHGNLGEAGIYAPIRAMPMNENWGHACFQNMSVNTRLVCYWRVGVEIQAHPDSTFSPYLKLSPPHDFAAIESYYRIARQLKDAYPADYNDLGKLWGVIKSAARTALPIVGAMGPFGAMAAGLGSFLLGPEKAAKAAKASVPKPSSPQAEVRDRPPAAVIEAAQSARQATDFLHGCQLQRPIRVAAAAQPRRRQRGTARRGMFRYAAPVVTSAPQGGPRMVTLSLKRRS